MFEGSKLPLRKWFVAIYEIISRKKGLSLIELSKRISVTCKTAWFMNQRIRECFGIVMEEKLDGEVEPDENFVGGKNKNRHYNKKVQKCQGGSFKDKVIVMGMLQLGGKAVCKVVRDTSYKLLTAPLLRTEERTATLFYDKVVRI